MRPRIFQVIGGQVVAFPVGTLPLRTQQSACGFDTATALDRIGRDHAALGQVRGAWRDLGIAEQPIMLSDAGVVAVLEKGARDKRFTLVWISNGRANLKPVPAVVVLPDDPPGPVAQWSKYDKIAAAMRRALTADTITPEITKLLLQLISKETIAMFIGTIALLVAVQGTVAAPFVDAGLLAIAYVAAGLTGVTALGNLAATTVDVVFADSLDEIARAGNEYAEELVALTATFLTLLLMRMKPSGGKAMEAEAHAKVTRRVVAAMKEPSSEVMGSDLPIGQQQFADLVSLPPEELTKLANIADKHNADVYLKKSSSKITARRFKEGWKPKPNYVKSKSVNEVDIKYLGADVDKEGLVWHHRPKELGDYRFDGISEEEKTVVEQRIRERQEVFDETVRADNVEWHKNVGKDVFVDDQGYLLDVEGKPFRSDNDVYHFVSRDPSKPLTPDQKTALQKDLAERLGSRPQDIDNTPEWETKKAHEAAIKDKVMQEARTEGAYRISTGGNLSSSTKK